MVEKGDLEPVLVVQLENALQQLHRRVARPEVGGEVADANLATPRMRQLATSFCMVRR